MEKSIDQKLSIRPLKLNDKIVIPQAFNDQGWTDKSASLYEHYFAKQEAGEFDVLVAEFNQEFAGYALICWKSSFIEFKDLGIPEIQDFNVLKKFQRKGIGTALMDEAEKRVALRSKRVGIAFGAHKDYAAAQILYVRRGYIPWGNGLTVSGRQLDFGETVTVDHSLMFHLTRLMD